MSSESQTEPTNESVLIIGSGIVGIACAHFLLEAGFEVTVIDRDSIAGACSHGNLGYICPSHVLPLTQPDAIGTAVKSFFDPAAPFRVKPRMSPAFVNWMWQFAKRCSRRQMLKAAAELKPLLDSSINEYRALLSKQPVECEWRESGLLHVFQTSAGLRQFAETEQLVADELGVRATRIEGADLTELDPALKPGLAGAFLHEGDAFVRPDLLNRNWHRQLESMGVTFIGNCEFVSLDKVKGRVSRVNTSAGTFEAGHFVFATGAWSARLAAHLDCRIPVEPGKGYSVTMQRPANCPTYPMLFPEHNVGVSPFEQGYRLGSMMEFVGFDMTIPDRRIAQLRESAVPYLSEPYTDNIQETWYGWRPMTWDSLPVIDRVPRLENAYVATGHNMLGLSLAAGTGKLIAEMVSGQSNHVDAQPFSVQRFQ